MLTLPEVIASHQPCRELFQSERNGASPPAHLLTLFNQQWRAFSEVSIRRQHLRSVLAKAGETGVRAQQLSVCTLQAGSVCSVDAEGVRRVSALSSVPFHGYVCLLEGERAGGWGKETNRPVWTGGGFSL